jgi:glyoxylase-like metal-dependent hydrolase (beta-lactamase superfamily II)
MKKNLPKLSRAQFLRSTGVLVSAMFLTPRDMFAQTSPVITIRKEAAKSPIVTNALRGNIYLLEGSGGNISVFHGKDGMMLVDSGLAVSKKRIIDALGRISSAPIKYLVNTHWHFDHADGNEWLHNAGATIIAHQNTKANLSRTITVKDWNYTFSPSSQDALPTVTFQKDKRITFNNSEIYLKYYAPGHTDSDISIYFEEADILQTGDTWWNSYYPFIDHSSGGSIDGMIDAANYNIAVTTNKTLIIPGHGAVGNRAQLIESRDMLVAVKEKISGLKASGMSLTEVLAQKPTAAYDGKFGQFLLDGAYFTRLVYADV